MLDRPLILVHFKDKGTAKIVKFELGDHLRNRR